MKGLVKDMVKENPADRPTIGEVVARFQTIRDSLHWWTLRRPIDRRRWPAWFRLSRMLPIAFRNMRYIVSGIGAIPTYTYPTADVSD